MRVLQFPIVRQTMDDRMTVFIDGRIKLTSKTGYVVSCYFSESHFVNRIDARNIKIIKDEDN